MVGHPPAALLNPYLQPGRLLSAREYYASERGPNGTDSILSSPWYSSSFPCCIPARSSSLRCSEFAIIFGALIKDSSTTFAQYWVCMHCVAVLWTEPATMTTPQNVGGTIFSSTSSNLGHDRLTSLGPAQEYSASYSVSFFCTKLPQQPSSTCTDGPPPAQPC